MMEIRVAHYLNQFFAGVGAEEAADHAPERREGPTGPGRLLAELLGAGGRVVSTLVCGDTYVAERTEAAQDAIRGWLVEVAPNLVLAGPAFAAGRYGLACATVCRVAAELGIAAVTGLHAENPGRLVYRRAYAVPTADSAAGMREALASMLRLGRRLAGGATLGPAEDEGYLPRGVRRPGLRDRPGAGRAVEMLMAKLSGGPFRTELAVEPYETVAPAAPVDNLRGACIALVTTGAIVPLGNPDRLRRSSETRWARYPIDGVDALSAERFECVHGGFYNATACRNPNLVLPVDALRALERDGRIGSLADFYCTTTGNDQRLGDCTRNGREIAAALRAAGVNGACLVAT